ncbi:hypothetical protein Slala05_38690 [Streptomyces lavendulae subsp. lavendulae]|nr:hypothetical protein Slala05_38690 [Streptomyces lavendulae subsp. lavendulae]
MGAQKRRVCDKSAARRPCRGRGWGVEQPVDRLLRAAGRCGLAFLLVLGTVALLPRAVREAVPDALVGGAVLLLGAVGVRRASRRPR